MRKAWPLFIIPLVIAALFARGAPVIPSDTAQGSVAGAVETDPALLGAPQPGTSEPAMTSGGHPARTPSAAPQETGGIGQPASYCKPGYCDTPEPRVVVSKGTGAVVGDATYYCRPGISRCTVGHPFGMYAAAGPEVRAMVGPDWRGRFVIVTDETGRGVVVQLIDFCACSGSHVIDLYWTAYQGMVNPVTVKEEP